MDKKKIIAALKEHNPNISELYSDEELHNFLTGLETASDVVLKIYKHVNELYDELYKNDEQFRWLADVHRNLSKNPNFKFEANQLAISPKKKTSNHF